MRVEPIYVWAAAAPLAVAGFWALEYAATRDARLPGAAELRRSAYVASGECAVCHHEQHRTWRATYHRTMTAKPSPETVKAPMPASLRFYGYDVTFREENGEYFADLPWFDGKYRRFPLHFTIGSRRMQQFAIKDGDNIYRLPVFWSIEQGKWMHINEAFFRRRRPDALESFTQGYSIWNPNCIFCHNTRPDPGLDPKDGKTFRSSVAELGIACEECHAPGEIHARVNTNPLRRYLYQYTARRDETVAHALRGDHLRGTQMCGQCHGQRLPNPLERIAEIMTKGDPYMAGADLFDYYKPIDIHDELENYKQFHLRFWKDGSPRLTAYEMQGLLASACFKMDDSMTCVSCHAAHGGDPKGMLEPEMRTNLACTQCHGEYAERAAAEKHSGHARGDADCYSCHMPEIAYGVMTIHPTHLIRNPDPSRTVRHDMPEACNLCHLDKSVNWAIRETNRLWNKNLAEGGAAFDAPEIVRGLAQADVVHRAVILHHARKRNLRGFEYIYRRALDDPFYIVGNFAELALEARYGDARSGRARSAAEWREYLDGLALRPMPEFDALYMDVDEDFEFGE